jgi:hypothetical protein
MSKTNARGVWGDYRVRNAIDVFTAYVKQEEQRRRNSDEPFNEALFNESVELVLRHLKADEGEVRS